VDLQQHYDQTKIHEKSDNWFKGLTTDTINTYSQKQKFKAILRLTYEGVFKSFRTGRLERELQMAQLSTTRCSYIAIL
jgi:methylphosphotriester-DNA--protein-cysteine methyltransferase